MNNFGYNFGVPRAEQGETNSQDGDNKINSEYSIDLDQITPPTFKFGQFGQAPLPSDNNNVIDGNDNNENFKDNDEDSFLAEPSMSTGQFDAAFTFHNEPTSVDSFENGKQQSPSVPSTASTHSVPALIEEPLEQPVFLEEPAPHSVEELLKATVDGDTTAVMMESWENVGLDEIEAAEAEFARIAQESLVNEPETAKPEAVEPEAVESEAVEPEVAESEVVDSEAIETAEPEPKVESEPEPIVKKEKKPKSTPAPKKTKVAEPKAAVITEGRPKRERKTVERLADAAVVPAKTVADKVPTIPSGSGVKLGEIEPIANALNKKLASDKNIILLHRILFDRMGDARHRKSSIRAFCGQDDAKFEDKLMRHTNADLKELANFLGLTGANEKAAIAAKISAFLVKPNKEMVKYTASGDRIVKKPKKAPAKPKSARTSKRINPDSPPKKTRGKPAKAAKTDFLTPETIDSDVESEVEREVLNELNGNN